MFGAHGIGEPPMAPAGADHRQRRLQRDRRVDRRYADHPRDGARGAQESPEAGGARQHEEFELYEPTTVQQAVGLLNQFGATGKALGGGSDLIGGIMKDWVQGKGQPLPVQIVDLTTIPDLKGIKMGADGAHIGATTTLAEIIEHHGPAAAVPAARRRRRSAIASPLIRNFGTLGGNINQRPRCWFFRGEDFNCYKKGGDFCYSVTGDNRYHAIIGGELCYIVHPSDTSTALLALNAQAKIVGPGGDRTVPFDQYFHGPREDVLTENVLKSNEVHDRGLHPDAGRGDEDGLDQAQGPPGLRLRRGRRSRRCSRSTAATGRTAASPWVAWRLCRTAPRSSKMRSRARTSRPPSKQPRRRFAPWRGR